MPGSTLTSARSLAPRTVPELVRSIAAVGLAGLVTGISVGGFGSRLFMRMSAMFASDAAQGVTTEAGETVGAITLSGTLGLVVFVGIAVAIMVAVLYATFGPWLTWAGRFRGLAFGLVLFAVASATSDVLNPDNFDFSVLGNRALNVAMIVLLFLAAGLVMELMFRVMDRRLPPTNDEHPSARVVYGMVTGLGVVLALLAVPGLLFSPNCECDAPILASVFVVVTAVATLTLWATTIGDDSQRKLSIARVLGVTGLAGTLVFGLWRAVSDAISILTA